MRIPRVPQKNQCQGDRAFVLVIVLWMSAGLVTLALLFGQSMMLEYQAADNTWAGAQAAEAIEGAARYAMAVLTDWEEPGIVPEITAYLHQEVEVGDAMVWFLGRDPNAPSGSRTSVQPVFGLIDECSKLNLNTATVEMLKLLPRMTDELAAAIVDWRDEDDEVTENGAESNAYQLRSPAYACKNAEFETVEELCLLIGADWEILYGEDANLNGILDPNENDGNVSWPPDNQDGRLDPGILEYVTVYSREPNQRADSSARINITGDSSQEFQTLLQEKLGEERAAEIQVNLGSDLSSITSVLEVYIKSQMKEEEFAAIAGEISISDESYLPGLININTAPEAVLACIPGIGTAHAAAVVSYRQSNAGKLDSVAWLANVLDEAGAIAAGPYVTTRSYQYTADIAALGHEGKGYRRVRFVIDASEEEPVIRYRRDLTPAGWALGREIQNRWGAWKGENRVQQARQSL